MGDPDAYAAHLLDVVLRRFSLPDTRTTVLHDWMKGRHSEYREINGLVVDVLARHGEDAPHNAHVVALSEALEAGRLERGPGLREKILDAATIR